MFLNNNKKVYFYSSVVYFLLLNRYPGILSDCVKEWGRDYSQLSKIIINWSNYLFGQIISLFKFIDYKKCQKLMESPIAKHHVVCALLENCHNCIYGEKHTEYFNCLPPTLEDYLSQ